MITNSAQGRQIVKEADTYSISSSLYLINTYQNVTESPSTCVQYSNSRLHFGYIRGFFGNFYKTNEIILIISGKVATETTVLINSIFIATRGLRSSCSEIMLTVAADGKLAPSTIVILTIGSRGRK